MSDKTPRTTYALRDKQKSENVRKVYKLIWMIAFSVVFYNDKLCAETQ